MNEQERRVDFFKVLEERYRIFLRREAGEPKPWTDDPVFLENRFCNVFREDDKTTVWFREKMRNHPGFNSTRSSVIITTIAFRWFNKIEIGEILRDPEIGLYGGCFHSDVAKRLILKQFPNGPFVTGAYVVKTPDGMNKLDGVLWCIANVARDAVNLGERLAYRKKVYGPNLEDAWKVLRAYPFLGDFMSYEIVTDLYHTPVLAGASDVHKWANPGPGCARGISRILFDDPAKLDRGSNRDRQLMLNEMVHLLDMSRSKEHWPWAEERPWTMREVEHGLCEVDKMFRARAGGRMKQRYNGRE